MDKHGHAKTHAQTEQNESLLILRVFRVVDEQGALVREHGLSVFERDLVLAEIGLGLPRIPLEANT